MNTEPDCAGPKPDPAVVALARATERNTRKLSSLDADVRALAETVGQRSTTPPPSPAETPEAGTGGLRCWLLTEDPVLATAAVSDLTAWLHEVYLHYPDSALSSCWLWHPAVVEELWWLRCAHADAYDPENGSWLRVGDWHDRQRPGVARRVRSVLGKCDLSRHAPRGDRPADVVTTSPGAPLVRHAEALAAAWTTDRALPHPSTEQLDEAGTHNREHLWKQR